MCVENMVDLNHDSHILMNIFNKYHTLSIGNLSTKGTCKYGYVLIGIV